MSDREPLSVCIIAFNEEANIRACLESVAWADEVVVVDSMSTDATDDICREMGARLIQNAWPGYVAQKNFALDQAAHDWALSIDADERVTPALREEIEAALRAAKAGESDRVGYSMPRRTFYMGRWMRHIWYPDRKLRLVKRALAEWKGRDPHDHLYVDGPTCELRSDLRHYSYASLSDHLRTIDRFSTVGAEALYRDGKRAALPHMLFNPPVRALKLYLLKGGFLDGVPGLVAGVLSGYYVFAKYAKLWEMVRAQSRHGGAEDTEE